MRDFTAAAGRLRSLSLGAKLLYTAFTVASVIGLLVSWRLYGAMVHDAGSAGYYAGAAVVAPAPTQTAAPAEGPALDLGPELDLPATPETPRVLVEQISERKLLEVTHFHLFSVPVYVLILAHLWLLARLPSWLHTAGVVAAVFTSGLHMAAPWLIRGAPGAAALMPVSGVAMLLSLGAMAVVSTVDMWSPRRSRRGEAPPPSEAE
ncbi:MULTISPECIES: hypothetical protein [Sorangium]|uniref:Uncharacterized protein n=1 Tax=Sorangium cellulosum TaxID=56 RepID=A0A150QK18_SORCE|nr:hypothetical protein [Sorangium cellulosum]KYF68331.1 hypothetical protein BE15_05540 [Sorangium cellulosum]